MSGGQPFLPRRLLPSVLPTLVYDDRCGPCARMKDVVTFLDPHRGIRCLGIDEAEGEGLLSGVSPALRRRSFHFISPDGSVRSGAGALPELVGLLPAGWLPSKIMAMNPLIYKTTSLVYFILSRIHDAGSCKFTQDQRTFGG